MISGMMHLEVLFLGMQFFLLIFIILSGFSEKLITIVNVISY